MGFKVQRALDALRQENEAKINRAVENIRAYDDAVGIGEHPDIVSAVEDQVKEVVEARDMLEALTDIQAILKDED
jgi:hypothetical protein